MTNGDARPSGELNQGDGPLGIDLEDAHCPDCGRETRRTMFTYRAYCPVCDTLWGRVKSRLGLVDTEGGCDA